MKGQVWKVYHYDVGARQDRGALLAELSAEGQWEFSKADAHDLARRIALMIGKKVILYRGRARSGVEISANPTLYHHGLAHAAQYHLVGEHPAYTKARGGRPIPDEALLPLADIYFAMERWRLVGLAQDIARATSMKVRVYGQKGPFHGRRPRLAEHPLEYEATRPAIRAMARNPRGGPADETAAHELELYIDNDAALYRQQYTPILQNLWRKMKRGVYDHEKAVKLWGYLVESGAKKYAREFSSSERDWSRIFSPATRLLVARSLAHDNRARLEAREFTWQQEKNPRGGPRIVYNKLLGGWYVVVGPHQTPLNGRFNSKAEAQAWLSGESRRKNPGARKGAARRYAAYQRQKAAAARGERLTVHEDYWIEKSTDAELAEDPHSPYRMVTSGGQRYALSALDAIRAQKQGLEFRTGNPRRRRALSVPEQHQLKIARQTLRLRPEFVRILGGPSVEEAREIIHRLTGRWPSENPVRRYGSRAKYRHQRVQPPSHLDPRSMRTVKSGKARIVVGCPKGHYHPRAKGRRKCDVGMETQAVLRPKKNPATLKVGDRVRMSDYHLVRFRQQHRGFDYLRGPERVAAEDALEQQMAKRGTITAVSPNGYNIQWDDGSTSSTIHYLIDKATNPGRRSGNPFPAAHRNPAMNPRELAAARRTFRMWHDFEPDHVTRVHGPDRVIPRTLVKLGEVPEFVYRSDKWEGKPALYSHKTKRPHPVLATDPKGRHLYLVGGRTKVTAAGLVH